MTLKTHTTLHNAMAPTRRYVLSRIVVLSHGRRLHETARIIGPPAAQRSGGRVAVAAQRAAAGGKLRIGFWGSARVAHWPLLAIIAGT